MDVHPPKYSKIGFDTSTYFMIFHDFFNGDRSKILNAALRNKHGIGLIAVDQQQLG
jgi:hypothetical protein